MKFAWNDMRFARNDMEFERKLVENYEKEKRENRFGKKHMIRIKETIVVEGKDDISAVRKAVDANIICTHGYGISEETVRQIRAAYEATGLVIFTDPDHAGLSIREKLTKLFPEAKQAYLTRTQARKKDDIGIENARPEDICRAVLSVAEEYEEGTFEEPAEGADEKTQSGKTKVKTGPLTPVTEEDIRILGLSGEADSAEKREKAGAKLGIGYANAKTFLKRIRYMGISREILYSALLERDAEPEMQSEPDPDHAGESGKENTSRTEKRNPAGDYRIILASASPRRRDILKKVVPCYECMTQDVDERKIEKELEAENAGLGELELAGLMVERLSFEKAKAVFESLENRKNVLVIGADTTVALPDEILGKPKDREDAVRMLRKESLEPQHVITGVSLLTEEKTLTFSETSRVVFYPLDEAQEERIREYCDTDEPYDKAGGYGIQALGDKLVERFEGSFDNIIGLPTERLRKELEGFFSG